MEWLFSLKRGIPHPRVQETSPENLEEIGRYYYLWLLWKIKKNCRKSLDLFVYSETSKNIEKLRVAHRNDLLMPIWKKNWGFKKTLSRK